VLKIFFTLNVCLKFHYWMLSVHSPKIRHAKGLHFVAKLFKVILVHLISDL